MAPTARWYFDADTIGTGKVLARVRDDVTYPGDNGQRTSAKRSLPPCPIRSTATNDDEWIPIVTRLGMSIITRDKRILMRTSELAAVVDSGARMFAIASPTQLGRWELLEVVVSQWRHMEEKAREPGPFVYSLTRTGLRKLDIGA